MKFLQSIYSPNDVKKLNMEELEMLAREMRTALIEKLSITGGHLGSNLGVIELATALHFVFDSPKDKIIWDVSHQCYAHKMLTGRMEAFVDSSHYKDVTGFTNPKESEHDFFTIGHTATSVSLALGMAKGRDLAGTNESIIAVIGDGSLSGGEAYEALNFAGEYKNSLIVIINDNDQSVAENHGGIYKMLENLRNNNGECENNLFKSLGFDYRYIDDGHDIEALIKVFEDAKNALHPIVIHVHTIKGKGLDYAEADKESWHSAGPFNISDGSPKNGPPIYDTTVHDSLVNLLEHDKKSVILTAGTPRALGFVGEERKKWALSGRFVDVGIAEENAVAMSSGIAKSGCSAVVGIYTPFLQRAYDQISHDLCLNDNPATILVLLPGAYGMKSNTHIGMCDIQMLSHIPNLIYLSPAYKEEYNAMFEYATAQKEHPIAIRVPVRFYESGKNDCTDYSVTNKAKVLIQGEDVAIIAVGMLVHKALDVAFEYKKNYGRDITVINPVFLTGTDGELLENLKADHKLIITLEDGELDGGYGQRIASFYGDSDMLVKNFGISKEFHSDFDAEDILAQNGISVQGIINYINSMNI